MGIRDDFSTRSFLGENLTKWLFTSVNALVRKDISTLDEGLVTESEVKVMFEQKKRSEAKTTKKVTKTYRQRKGLSPR